MKLSSTSEMPRVSVAVPVYGVERYIERCARSLFEQTYPNIEYVFVDDCTPDRSIEILMRVIEDYPERKNDVKIIQHKTNKGLACTRNDAVENCTSEFITHVDSDDWVERNMVTLMVEKQQEKDADIVSVGRVTHVNGGMIERAEPEHLDSHSMTLALLKPSQAPNIWGRLIRRSLYVDNSIKCLEGVNYAEDWQVIPKLSFYAKKVIVVNKVLYHYNLENPSSAMNTCNSAFRSDYCRQELCTIDHLKSFFADKGRDYCDALLGIELREIQNYMNLFLNHHNRQFFNEIVPRINRENKHLWHILGTHNYLVIIIKKNYNLHKIYLWMRQIKLSMNTKASR